MGPHSPYFQTTRQETFEDLPPVPVQIPGKSAFHADKVEVEDRVRGGDYEQFRILNQSLIDD